MMNEEHMAACALACEQLLKLFTIEEEALFWNVLLLEMKHGSMIHTRNQTCIGNTLPHQTLESLEFIGQPVSNGSCILGHESFVDRFFGERSYENWSVLSKSTPRAAEAIHSIKTFWNAVKGCSVLQPAHTVHVTSPIVLQI